MEVAGDGKTGQRIHYRRVGLATMTKVRKVFVQYLEIKVIIRHSRQRYILERKMSDLSEKVAVLPSLQEIQWKSLVIGIASL